MYYLTNFKSFLLDINTPLNNYFDIKILFQKNQTKNNNENITQKIFFEFISAEVSDNYDEESEIGYKILNLVKIPYYINSTNDFEIIKMKTKFSNIIINKIVVEMFGNDKIYTTTYKENNIMKFSDDEYYFEFYYQRNNITKRTYYLQISINSSTTNDSNFLENDAKDFKIIRMKSYNLNIFKKNITVSQEPVFYYIDLTVLNFENKNYNGLLLYTKELKNSIRFHLGIYNSYSEELKMKESFYYIEKGSFENKIYI